MPSADNALVSPILIEWGNVEAMSDRYLPEYFVNTPNVQESCRDDTWIISGEKGSGKTALKRVFAEESFGYSTKFHKVINIDFQVARLTTIEPLLDNIIKSTGATSLDLLINYWEFILITETAKHIHKHDTPLRLPSHPNDAVASLILQYFHNLSKSSIIDGFQSIAEFAWTFFEEKKATPNLGVQPSSVGNENFKSARKNIMEFPLDQDAFISIQDQIIDVIKKAGKPVLLVLDGFDGVINAKQAASPHIQTIFIGLVEAVLTIKRDPELSKCLKIKALIPYDRYLALNPPTCKDPIRDMDKIRSLNHSIHWTKADLKDFVAKRISVSLNTYFSTEDALCRILPKHIINETYGLAENTFDYVLRHTLWRPRHVQEHFLAMTKALRLASVDKAGVIEEHHVRGCISAQSIEMVKCFIEEYAIDHPNIGDFIDKFKGISNVMPFKKFALIVENFIHDFGQDDKWQVLQKIDCLYKMGFFGYLRKLLPKKSFVSLNDNVYLPPQTLNKHQIYWDFYYRSNIFVPVVREPQSDSTVGIHPIFFDYCGMVAHKKFIVG
jgi:hypothetical protein